MILCPLHPVTVTSLDGSEVLQFHRLTLFQSCPTCTVAAAQELLWTVVQVSNQRDSPVSLRVMCPGSFENTLAVALRCPLATDSFISLFIFGLWELSNIDAVWKCGYLMSDDIWWFLECIFKSSMREIRYVSLECHLFAGFQWWSFAGRALKSRPQPWSVAASRLWPRRWRSMRPSRPLICLSTTLAPRVPRPGVLWAPQDTRWMLRYVIMSCPLHPVRVKSFWWFGGAAISSFNLFESCPTCTVAAAQELLWTVVQVLNQRDSPVYSCFGYVSFVLAISQAHRLLHCAVRWRLIRSSHCFHLWSRGVVEHR